MYYRPKIFFPKKSYSSYGEDKVIVEYFKNKKKGIYVDVGCYHPLVGSNTYLLYKKNWKGVNIDVNQLSIDLFNRARKDDENINIAISNTKKRLKLFFRREINMLNTVNKKYAQMHFKKGFNEKEVKADTLDSILKRTRYKLKQIDFLNLDVEGNELNVLKSLNFKKYNPKLICVEIHNYALKSDIDPSNLKNNLTYKFLLNKKYKPFWNNGFSYIFIKT